MRLTVYLPAPGHYTPISEGSGIVGGREADHDGKNTGAVIVDYEGNLFGASNVRTWADRLHHAASRHVNRYPTTARALLPAEALIMVGSYDYPTGRLTVDGDKEGAIADWLGLPPPRLGKPDLLRAEMFRSGS